METRTIILSAVAGVLFTGCYFGRALEEAFECWDEEAVDALVDTNVRPTFEYSFEWVLENNEWWDYDTGGYKIQAWDCIDLSWWSSVGPQKVVQVWEDVTECEAYENIWTEYYECNSHEGSDAPFRDYDGDGVTAAQGDCDDEDPAVDDDPDGDGWPDCLDLDEDGYSVQEGDCDDDDASVIRPDADGDGTSDCEDDDGDGLSEWDGDTNDGDPAVCGVDTDQDGTDDCSDDDGDGLTEAGGDCNDQDSEVGAIDEDGDGSSDCVDDDRDGLTEFQGDCNDQSKSVGATDEDGDGTSDCLDDDGDGLTEEQGDCDDGDPAVGSVDEDGDGSSDCIDDDMDGLTEEAGDCDDQNVEVGVIDTNGDGNNDCVDDDGDGVTELEGDCDDSDPGTSALDLNGDGTNDCLDDDGDGLSERDGDCDDKNADVGVIDEDGDGNNDCTDDDGDGTSEQEGDCDDTQAEIHIGAADVCDGIDNDCDKEQAEGGVDEDPDLRFYVDQDADGYGSLENSAVACTAPSGYVDNVLDCDDTDAAISPEGIETGDNGIDENCDGLDIVIDAYVTPDGTPIVMGVPTYSSIQAAIDATATGKAIAVTPGTYAEKLDFKGKNLTLLSTEGPEKTIIDGGGKESSVNGRDSVLLFISGEGNVAPAVVRGFTLTGGRGTDGGTCGFVAGNRYGGAICAKNSSPRIEGNIIENNSVRGSGGAMYLDMGPVDVVDNIIRWNSSGYDAAGINLSQSGGTISGNVIVENHAARDGAGIYAFESDPLITNNIVAFNTSEDVDELVVAPGKGAGICLYDAYPQIRNNIIAYNSANDKDGGGIWVANLVSGGELVNNTIVGNHAAGEGGGIRITAGGLIAMNNIVAYNTAANGGNVYNLGTEQMTSSYNFFFVEGGGSAVVGFTLDTTDRNVDPGFEDGPDDGQELDDDYRLAAGSSAIDAGNPGDAYDDPDGSRNDAGASGGPRGGDFEYFTMADIGIWLN